MVLGFGLWVVFLGLQKSMGSEVAAGILGLGVRALGVLGFRVLGFRV